MNTGKEVEDELIEVRFFDKEETVVILDRSDCVPFVILEEMDATLKKKVSCSRKPAQKKKWMTGYNQAVDIFNS